MVDAAAHAVFRVLDGDVSVAQTHAGFDPLFMSAVTDRQREDQERAADDHRRCGQHGAPQMAAQVAHGQDGENAEMHGQESYNPERVSAGGTRDARTAG